MQICIYGTEEDGQIFASVFAELKYMLFRQIKTDLFDSYDGFVNAIKENEYGLIVIMKDNADGMEGVIAAKSLLPEVPIIWFSNDRDFGAQSYRLNASYFHEKPVTSQVLSKALTSCRLI